MYMQHVVLQKKCISTSEETIPKKREVKLWEILLLKWYDCKVQKACFGLRLQFAAMYYRNIHTYTLLG